MSNRRYKKQLVEGETGERIRVVLRGGNLTGYTVTATMVRDGQCIDLATSIDLAYSKGPAVNVAFGTGDLTAGQHDLTLTFTSGSDVEKFPKGAPILLDVREAP